MSNVYVPSVLELVQLAIAGRADAAPCFAGTTVQAVRPRSAKEAVLIQNKIDQALAGLLTKNGKGGTVIRIGMAVGNDGNPAASLPEFDALYQVTVMENPLISMGATGSLQSAEELVLNLMGLLHNYYLAFLSSTLTIVNRTFTPKPELLDKGIIGYDVFFRVSLRLGQKRPAEMATLTITDGLVSATAFNEGAQIYLTTDNSYPAPTAANLYAAPVPVTSGQLVLAVVTAPGFQDSNLQALSVP